MSGGRSVRRRRDFQALAAAIAGLAGVPGASLRAEVNLAWRPANQTAPLGQTVDIALYALSSNQDNEPFANLGVVFSWDETRLELLGINGQGAGYPWLNSFFPDDRGLDGINDDCEDGLFCDPYTGLPFNDGDAYYEAWGQFPPSPLPVATPGEGLLVTRFSFRTLRSGVARIQFVPVFGDFTRTRVIHPTIPGREITGVLGPPILVTILTCALPPTVLPEGSRYLAATLAPGDAPVAVLISGEPSDDRVACISKYVQPDGRLNDEPVFQTPAEWGTVHVFGEEIIPSAPYRIQADCGTPESPDLSNAALATTWAWGDIDNSGFVNQNDINLVLDASRGIFGGVTIYNVDQAGCIPNGLIDTDDILNVLDASQGRPYSCPEICLMNVFLDDLFDFVACLLGPLEAASLPCAGFDFDHDGNVDLRDVRRFQVVFRGPS